MPIPSPNADESREDFITRCHIALNDEIPNTDQRNAVCFRQWHAETEVEKMARQMFPADKFEHVKEVPIFAEHEITDKTGKRMSYDREALQKIVNKCNERIADTGCYAKLSDGHTPDPADVSKGAKQPDVLGYVGNFRLGMIGNVKPRWAILADEYRYKDKAEYTSRRPGRSVEVWLHDDIAERFFDPIAALGAETPRLDLPMKLSKSSAGVMIAKYSAVLPSASNTYLPEALNEKKERYATMLSPEELKEISAQIGQSLITPVVTALTQAMQQQVAAMVPPPPTAAPVVPPPPPPPPAAAPVAENMGGMEEEGDEFTDEEDSESYMGMEGDDDEEDETPDMEKSKMSKRNSSAVEIAKYQRQLDDERAARVALEKRVAMLQRESVNAQRYAKILDLEAAGYVLRDETNEKGEVVKYGRDKLMSECEDLSEKEFNARLTFIAEHGQKVEQPQREFYSRVDKHVAAVDMTEKVKADRKRVYEEAKTRLDKYKREGGKQTTSTFQEFQQQVAREFGVTL